MDACSLYVLDMQRDVLIAGVPFVPLHHRDGRRVRGAGLFIFARRTGDARVIPHMELASAINLRAGPGHARWDWAISNGMNELLVCLASAPLHEDAEFWPINTLSPDVEAGGSGDRRTHSA